MEKVIKNKNERNELSHRNLKSRIPSLTTHNTGITLIALVVTIVVLLILAGITISMVFGGNGILSQVQDAKIRTDQAGAREKVQIVVMGSLGTGGKIDINTLKEKLKKTEGVAGAETITSLPAKVTADGYKLIIEKNGNVRFDDESDIETTSSPIYARVYTKNGTSNEVLILASSNEAFSDYSSELTLKEDFGDVVRTLTIEDLYNIPEYAEILQSDEWKEYMESNPEEAMAVLNDALRQLMAERAKTWLTFNGDEYENQNLVEVRILDEIFPFDTSAWFSYCSNLKIIIGIENLNLLNVTNMYKMFFGCESLTGLDVSNFNTSNVTTMSLMFGGCESLTQLDVSNFDTTNVTEMKNMFKGCESLTKLDVSNFNTSNVTDMSSMFEACTSLTELDVSNFDTSNVMTMSSMFSGCNSLKKLSLKKLDVSNFNTSNVTDMSNMFGRCSSLTSLDVSNFDTSKVTNMSEMFFGCESLTGLDVSNFNTSNVMKIRYMFNDCKLLETLDLSNFDTRKVESYYDIFGECSVLNTIYIGENWTLDITNESATGTGISREVFVRKDN